MRPLGTAALVFCLAGCGLSGCVDAGATYMPAILRTAGPVQHPEPTPNVRRILETDLASVFLPASEPSDIHFSAPTRDAVEWSFCVRAVIHGATGRVIGMRTFKVTLDDTRIGRREATDETSPCASQVYEKL